MIVLVSIVWVLAALELAGSNRKKDPLARVEAKVEALTSLLIALALWLSWVLK